MQVSKAKNIYLLSEQGYFLLCGFGENQKVILAKTIAEIHENRLDKRNDLIKNNLSRFNENELIDLKSKPSEGLQFEQLGFTKMQIAKSNNIFLLSYKTKINSVFYYINFGSQGLDYQKNLYQLYNTNTKGIYYIF